MRIYARDSATGAALAVSISQGRITSVESSDETPSGWLAPAFFDPQINGCLGIGFNSPTLTPDGVRTVADECRTHGIGAFCPTVITDSFDALRNAFATLTCAAETDPDLARRMPCFHLEGPYLAPARKGTHDDAKFRVPDADEIAMATSLDNGISLLTLAPERVPTESIRAIVQRGGIVTAGHTAGSYDEIRAGIDAGISGFTHLYNAMTPLQGREPGAVGAALEDDACWCGVIVDGVHVHPASLRVALKAKPRGRVFLVTDAMPMVGGDDPSFDLYGETITAVDGVVRNAAGALAGSALDMASAVRNSVHLLGLPLDEACRMAAQYPAEFLGIGGTHGRIAAGYRADLVLLDGEVRVQRSWIGGVE